MPAFDLLVVRERRLCLHCPIPYICNRDDMKIPMWKRIRPRFDALPPTTSISSEGEFLPEIREGVLVDDPSQSHIQLSNNVVVVC